MAAEYQTTPQMRLWQGAFGRRYTDRNTYTPAALDRFYAKTLGKTLTAINRDLLQGKKVRNVLEVGCNIGMKLKHLQHMGYENLYGIELQADAVQRAKENTRGINILQGSAFDLPFKDGFFDLVYTNGVLIHIHPDDLKQAMREIVRCSGKYVMGLEYFAKTPQEIAYRGKKNALWRNNFPAVYRKLFPGLKTLREAHYPYLHDKSISDAAFLLAK